MPKSKRDDLVVPVLSHLITRVQNYIDNDSEPGLSRVELEETLAAMLAMQRVYRVVAEKHCAPLTVDKIAQTLEAWVGEAIELGSCPGYADGFATRLHEAAQASAYYAGKESRKAIACYLGTTVKVVNSWFKGSALPTPSDARSISTLLGVPYAWLLWDFPHRPGA